MAPARSTSTADPRATRSTPEDHSTSLPLQGSIPRQHIGRRGIEHAPQPHLTREPQGIDPPTFRASSAVSWWRKKERDVILDLNATQKDPHAIHKAKPHQDRSSQLSISRSSCRSRTSVCQLLRTNRLWHRRIHKGQLRRRQRPILRHKYCHGLCGSHRSTIERATRAELSYFSRPRGHKMRQPSTSLRGHSLLLSGTQPSEWRKVQSSPLLQLTRAHPEVST